MKAQHQYLFLSVIAIVSLSFSQCASTHKLQETLPITIGQIYYQNWTSGIKGGGSGINLYIPIENKPVNMVLDSVYFKNKRGKLEQLSDSLYIARFTNNAIIKTDIIMSNDPYAEYGNTPPLRQQETPFELDDNECVLVYLEGDKYNYFKWSGIIKKEPVFYPSVPPKMD